MKRASESRIVASRFMRRFKVQERRPKVLLLKGVSHFKIKNLKTRVTFSSSIHSRSQLFFLLGKIVTFSVLFSLSSLLHQVLGAPLR
ncbi:hypothetical protein PIB30_093565 [Stylosanthes scabra]|uniref:DUF4817 domain-containing protein n=1 Tax=Stylosanthes scabra TaxID=79078 RepID=A0ABU6RWK3_9FABA|nr:hypothetical protein [Stylosanthes scabra]